MNTCFALHDIAGWFLDDVLVNILGDLPAKTLVMMGFAETGKTPVAQAIAMAMSDCHCLLSSKDQGERHAAILSTMRIS